MADPTPIAMSCGISDDSRALVWADVHNAWWGPNRAGYYTGIGHAGVYTLEEAREIERMSDRGDRARPLAELPEHRRGTLIGEMQAEIVRLRELVVRVDDALGAVGMLRETPHKWDAVGDDPRSIEVVNPRCRVCRLLFSEAGENCERWPTTPEGFTLLAYVIAGDASAIAWIGDTPQHEFDNHGDHVAAWRHDYNPPEHPGLWLATGTVFDRAPTSIEWRRLTPEEAVAVAGGVWPLPWRAS